MNDKQRKSGFIMIWPDELSELKIIGASGYTLLQIYRFYKDRDTSICSMSDLSIQRLIGWDHKRTTRARKILVSRGLIEHIGYHQYRIPNHDIYRKTSGETPELLKKTSGETPELVRAKRPNTSGETPEQLGRNAPVHNIIDRKDVVDTPDNNNFIELSKDLEALIEELLKAQGIIASPLRRFYYTVVRERRFHKYHEGLIKIAIKRAIAANSKANIQDILSYDALSAIKADQDRIRQQSADDNMRAAWAKEPRFEGTKKGD